MKVGCRVGRAACTLCVIASSLSGAVFAFSVGGVRLHRICSTAEHVLRSRFFAGAVRVHMQGVVPQSFPGKSPETPETFRRKGECKPGVYVKEGSPLAAHVFPSIRGLRSWSEWYQCPSFLGMSNGHVHTILSSQLRKTANVCYARRLLPTPDGGTVALDMLQSVLAEGMGVNECQFREDDGSVLGDAANSDKDFLLLVAGLGGGSDDPYVRSMGAAAVQSGRWQVGVVNMRGCGKAPVLSPRFFSAFRGATDDVRIALTYVRQHLRSGNKVAVVGWSNGATILNNALAEQASTHKAGRAAFGADAGVTLACPLNMPFASANLKRWFHASVYDRAIARSLSSKVSEYRHLFQDEHGAMKPVPAWEGLGEVGTKGAGSAGSNYVADEIIFTDTLRTIRSIDEAVTRRCFGFETVDEYYEHASSDQRLGLVDVPLMLVNAVDDPIAYLGEQGNLRLPPALQDNEHVSLVLTQEGGHLGWCDPSEPWKSSRYSIYLLYWYKSTTTDAKGAARWIEEITLQFLEKSLRV